ncbi:MAG: site-specific integrase [Thermoleophilia bacterium]
MAEGIRKRIGRNGTATYEASVWIATEKRRLRKTFPTQAAAKVWRTAALRAVREHRLRGPSGITFREAAEAWLHDAREGIATTRSGTTYKPGVILSYEQALQLRALPLIGGARLEDVTRVSLQRAVDGWAAQGLSGSTIRNALMPVRVVFRRAVRRGVVAVNPCDGLELPPPSPRRERIASPAEAARLLAVLTPRDRALWSIAVYAGLRAGEIAALRWGDIDLAGGRIRVIRSWDPKTGNVVAPKSKSAVRSVPIAGVLRDELLDWRVAHPADRDALLFSRPDGRPLRHEGVLRRARTAWKNAGLTPLGLHEARHTAVSVWLAAGINIRAVSTYAGHASVAFTLDRYGHLLPDDQDRAVQLLDAYIEQSTAGR